jgi:putative FmdB family regulatory protein
LPIYQVKCQSCGKEDEIITSIYDREASCRFCNQQTTRIPSVRGPGLANGNSGWIRSVLEVVEKDSDKPHIRQFLADPTRENYKSWMKGEGIRPLEPGEKTKREEPIDNRSRIDFMARRRQERNRIEIGR